MISSNTTSKQRSELLNMKPFVHSALEQECPGLSQNSDPYARFSFFMVFDTMFHLGNSGLFSFSYQSLEELLCKFKYLFQGTSF
jgi:hypothetical protein